MINTYYETTKSLDAAGNYELFKQYKENHTEELKLKIFYGNLALVRKYCLEYEKTLTSLTFEDLFIEGCMGLYLSIDNYDPYNKESCSFSTYSSYLILQHIYKALNKQDRMIRLPYQAYQILKRYGELKNDYSFDEIAKELNVNIKTLESIVNSQRRMISLDAPYPISEAEIESLYDYIQDYNQSVEETIIEKENVIILQKIIKAANLTDREKSIIIYRYGLNNKSVEPLTLEQVGKIFQITRERVRQIEVKALRKLRFGYRHIYKEFNSFYVF